ncbi:hypothetical protein ACLI1A_17725 [Flavobacterium sp. RHBU_3]|uniref:hypothetical protein n=1 Tax=Flavobacterium sp. RHBU_3 TaxID=3391184 RepID=UPI0039846B8D
MKRRLRILFVFLCFLLLVSCGKMITKVAVSMFKHNNPHYFTNGNRKVIFIPMIHINKPEFYDEVKQFNDSLRNEGYVFFYEGVRWPKDIDSLEQDTYKRKLRKVLGFNMSNYLDANNKDMKKYQIKGVVHQSPKNTGIDIEKDIRADYYIDSLIDRYEADKGKLILDDYDKTASFTNKYKGKKVSSSDRDYLMLTLRNKYLADKVAGNSGDKIVILYGAFHRSGFLEELKLRDSSWKEVKRAEYIK